MSSWEMFEKYITNQALKMGLDPETFHWEAISDGYEDGNVDPGNWLNYYKDLEN
jgi:hypothetical protein